MPYIKQEDRKILDKDLEFVKNNLTSRGNINYFITKIMHNFIEKNGIRYDIMNDAIGILECIKQELYRKVLSPYEEAKINENGGIPFEALDRKISEIRS